ncbi:toxin-antitoxin system, antitoxin component, HicB family [Cutibacterium acnes HL099PA1]|uniref:hypothetical protein n=1 Tax=Cutibacterium acnes TaxID=1747 RepID=UPI00020630F3|nr:hypothetical protein [Cutibacterium acnes]EGF74542.1 toxin-antitoxin system, antitoxin component, HicB family [Cutibacterium acnes HL099PA1]TLG53173.1 antitoxin HicB [Cutibacterium acnes]TMT70221.1 antitoxin HicB [Cutibacterium acnes]
MSSPIKTRRRGTRGPKPRSDEQLTAVVCRVPESVAEHVNEMAAELGVSRSDLVGWAALHALNMVRRDRDQEPLTIPAYTDKVMISALYRDALPLDEDGAEQIMQEELVMTG